MTKTHRTLALSLTLGLLGLTAFGGGAASAQTDMIVHPSSSCRWFTPVGEPFNPSYNTDGWHHGDASQSHLVVCAVDRFNLTNLNGLRDLDVRLNNMDDETPRTVSCIATSSRPDGTVVKSVRTDATFTGPYRIDFNGALNQSVAYGHYTVDCYLPAGVKLNNILQREY